MKKYLQFERFCLHYTTKKSSLNTEQCLHKVIKFHLCGPLDKMWTNSQVLNCRLGEKHWKYPKKSVINKQPTSSNNYRFKLQNICSFPRNILASLSIVLTIMTFLYGRYLNFVDIDSILIFANIVLFPFSAFVGRVANLISRSNVKLHIFVLEFLHFKSFRPSGQIWYEGQISLREALQWFLLSSSSWYQSIYMVLSVQMYLPHLSRSIMAGILNSRIEVGQKRCKL